jgi:hypothetical protein
MDIVRIVCHLLYLSFLALLCLILPYFTLPLVLPLPLPLLLLLLLHDVTHTNRVE